MTLHQTILRRSQFVHLLAVADTSVLALHAVTQMRVTVTPQVARLIAFFEQPRDLDATMPELALMLDADVTTVRACALMLLDRGILSDRTETEERAETLLGLQGRDPEQQVDRYRRSRMEGAHPYWSVTAPHALADPASLRHRIDILLLGDCDVQMEADFLRQAAARRGIDLRAAASFAGDIELARERPHDAVIIGALQARHAIVLGDPVHHDGDPARVYVDAVKTMLDRLRALTSAPILIDGLPEPTVQPLGFADRGIHSHRNRFRRTNLALAQLAEENADVYLVDVAAALGQAGSATLLDDGLVAFTHFGSAGWMLQRPASELAAVHHQFPDMAPLAQQVGGDPYRREAVIAEAHLDLLSIVLGLDARKCVIVDLDGVLWPGVLAETGRPFAWTPEMGGPNSYIGLYFGIHEALGALRRRGILLACVSKNDAETVRRLWRYQQTDPRHRLLRPEDFVCSRINWDDKAANIAAIADELGFQLRDFMFVDDSARERERVRHSLPDVAVLGEDLFTLRRALLSDPRLQPVRLTDSALRRSELVAAQLDRARQRAALPDEAAFVASLAVTCHVQKLAPDTVGAAVLARVAELIARTTQFNATGRAFTVTELQRVIGRADGSVFVLHMVDRLTDHGLVGAAVIVDGTIENLVMSCRVIGLGGEDALLRAVTEDLPALIGRIVPSERNPPVRHVYRDQGFRDLGDGLWAWRTTSATSESPQRQRVA